MSMVQVREGTRHIALGCRSTFMPPSQPPRYTLFTPAPTIHPVHTCACISAVVLEASSRVVASSL